MEPKNVQFGHQQVSPDEKTRLVNQVFETVARRYDLMNDLMSFGTHRLMKRMMLELTGARPGDRFLDLAGGTGDISRLLAPVVGASGQVVLADLTAEMMQVGRDRLLNEGRGNVGFCQLRAETLPFAEATFDGATIAFGLRNFTDKSAALAELCRVLKPGAALVVLEFSRPENSTLRAAYQGFQALWPGLGRLFVGNAQPYRYLVESIEVHPNQRQLQQLLEDGGFTGVEYHNLIGGIAAIHRAVRP